MTRFNSVNHDFQSSMGLYFRTSLISLLPQTCFLCSLSEIFNGPVKLQLKGQRLKSLKGNSKYGLKLHKVVFCVQHFLYRVT